MSMRVRDRSRLGPWAASAGLWVVLAVGGAGSAAADRIAVRTFTTTDGLAGDSVTALLEDSHGYLWIGSRSGLARFDGTTFTVYSAGDGLPQSSVTALVEDRNGELWVGTTGGLSRLLPQRRTDGTLFETMTCAGSLAPGSAACCGEVDEALLGPAGELWVARGPALCRVEPAEWPAADSVRLEFALPAHETPVLGALARDAAGAIWAANLDGFVRCPSAGPCERLVLRGRELAFDADGNAWTFAHGGLARLTPGPPGAAVEAPTAATAAAGAGHPAPPATPGRLVVWGAAAGFAATGASLSCARDGTILAATSGGLFVMRDGRLRRITATDGLVDDRLTELLEDANGNLWVGTEEDGLMRIPPAGFVGYTQGDGLLSRKLSQVLADGRGGVLLAGSPVGVGVHRIDGGRVIAARFALPGDAGDLGWAEGQALVLDHRGEWWVPTASAVFRFPAVARLEDLELARPVARYGVDELKAASVFRMFEDSRGDVWMGVFTPNRVARWERESGVVRHFTSGDGAPDDAASAFAEDSSGAVWAGFYVGGIARWRSGRFRAFGEADGVPGGFVSSLLADRSGRLWVGLLRHGVLRIDDPDAEQPRIAHYGRREGLGSEAVVCLAEGSGGEIWIGTRNGVDRLEPASGSVRHFDTASGLINNGVISMRADAAGKVWLATAGGASTLDVRTVPPPSPLTLRITALSAGGRAYAVPELGTTGLSGVRLPVGVRDVGISYTGITLVAGEVVRYRHRIGGGEWSAPAPERRLQLAGLSPGRLRLEIRAVRSDGAESEPAAVDLVLPPPLWRRPWAIGLEILLPGSLLALAWRARWHQRVELERVRARIASDLHDELGLSLSRIAVLSEVARRKAARGTDAGAAELQEIGEEARDLIDATSDMAWALDPASDDLPSLLARLRRMAADVFDGSGVSLTFTGPESTAAIPLGAEQRRHLYLILKEAIHNAARHARPRRVEVRVELEGGTISAEVRDDGAGFLSGGDAGLAGHGLTGMARRAEALGGRLGVESRPGGGTTVRVAAPLAYTT